MKTETRSRICQTCAQTGRLMWLPCRAHSVIIPAELCGHEFTSVHLINNGSGLSCHDCGASVAVITHESETEND